MSGKARLNPEGNGSVSMEEFIRTRDSVVTGLTKLNGAITTLIGAYVTHTNTLLTSNNQGQAILDTTELTNYLATAGLATPKAPAVDPTITKDGKKKRVKKEKDPNAPKRPLTAFFLFSTRARVHIKEELGASATPVEINNEILRRWNDMDGTQKEKWKDLYNSNYETYKQEVAEYKQRTGKDIEEGPADAEVPYAVGGAVEAEDDDDDDDDEEEDEPAKEPTPPPAKKGKAAKAKKAAAPPAPKSPSPSAQLQPPRSTVAIPLPGQAADNKKKRKGETAEEPKKTSKKTKKAEPEPPAPTPDKKAKKSKRKGD